MLPRLKRQLSLLRLLPPPPVQLSLTLFDL
jgi:hypothetical protein